MPNPLELIVSPIAQQQFAELRKVRSDITVLEQQLKKERENLRPITRYRVHNGSHKLRLVPEASDAAWKHLDDERYTTVSDLRSEERRLISTIYETVFKDINEKEKSLSTDRCSKHVIKLSDAFKTIIAQEKKAKNNRSDFYWYSDDDCILILVKTLELMNESINSPNYPRLSDEYLFLAKEMQNKPIMRAIVPDSILLVSGVAIAIFVALTLPPAWALGLPLALCFLAVAAVTALVAIVLSFKCFQQAALPRNLSQAMNNFEIADKNYKKSLPFFQPIPASDAAENNGKIESISDASTAFVN